MPSNDLLTSKKKKSILPKKKHFSALAPGLSVNKHEHHMDNDLNKLHIDFWADGFMTQRLSLYLGKF